MNLKFSTPLVIATFIVAGCALIQMPEERWKAQERAFLSGPSCSNVQRINCRPSDVFHPFGDFAIVDLDKKTKKMDDDFASGFMDPWIYSSEYVVRLRYAEITGQLGDAKYALKALKNLHATFLKNRGSFPHPGYGSFPDGWVSSMDIPVAALCAQIAVEMYGDLEYKNIRDDFLKVIDREPKNGGFYLPETGGMGWFSEYSHTYTTLENEMFVLNGFLISLQSVLMLTQSMGSDQLMDLYSKNLKKYKAIANKFWYADQAWSYYMLKPKEPVPPHYMIFETKQLNALQILDPNPTYQEELQRHRKALARMLPVYSVTDQQGASEALFYRAILDPYLIDIYQTKIILKDAEGNTVDTMISGEWAADYKEYHFINRKISQAAASFDFYTINSAGTEFKLFSENLKKVPASDSTFYSRINWKQLKISADYDGQLDGDVVSMEDSRSIGDEASIWIALQNSETRLFAKETNRFFGIELSSSSEKFIQLIMYDKDSKAAYRNYTKLVPGKNLVLLHWAGFYGVDDIGDPVTLRFRIFSNASDSTAAQVKIEGLVEFENEIGIFNYMKKPDYKVNLNQ